MLRFGEYIEKDKLEENRKQEEKRLEKLAIETAPPIWECFEGNQNAVNEYVDFITRNSNKY